MTKSKGILAPRRKWSEAEIALLRSQYPTVRAAQIAAQLPGRSTCQVLNKAWLLGLKKSPETIAQHARESMLHPNHGGRATQFKPGQHTWNKGTHFTAGGRSAETRFKKGQMPYNTRPIGSLRIAPDGSLQRKIGHAKGSNSKRWRGLHELAWVEANGPVPPGHICVFKQGMKTVEPDEITADKVECITLAENMRRNTVHNLPKPIAELVQLHGALVRKINRAAKEAA